MICSIFGFYQVLDSMLCTLEWKSQYKNDIHCNQEFIMGEGKGVSNVLYTLCNNSSESNMTSCLVHVTKPVKVLNTQFSSDYEK